MTEHEIPWAQVCGGEVESEAIDLYRIQGIPAFVLIDGEGKIVERFSWLDYSPETDLLDLIEERLEQLLED